MRRGWFVSGVVQGVGFRNFVQHHADRLRLSGWVRNLPDGRVEVVGCGVEKAILELEGLLERGPRCSQVTDVEKSEISDEVVIGNAFDVR